MHNKPTFDQLPEVVCLILQRIDELNKRLSPLGSTPDFMEPEKTLTVEQAAAFLGIKSQTVYQNIGRIPHRKRHGRLYFFVKELTDYLNEGK